MTTGILHDQNLEKQIEKQMGCMAGFFQLFDRQQILTGKRLYAAKRLPPSSAVDSTTESEKSVGSPAFSRELEKPQQTRGMTLPSPERLKASPVTEHRYPVRDAEPPANKQAKLQLPLPIFELKEGARSSWKFCKEAPRLSLDSRATTDAKGGLYPKEIRTNAAILSANRLENSGGGAAGDGDDKRRSPSVVARLMGLEQLPQSSPEATKKVELRRSASESRVSRDLFQYRFIDGNNFQQSHSVGTNISRNAIPDSAATGNTSLLNVRAADRMEYSTRNAKHELPKPSYRGGGASPWKLSQQRKNFYDSGDFFPEPKQAMSINGEIEKRLRMRGIDEPSMDLETLKQILEASQLKGLLHSNKPLDQINHRNFVYDRSFSSDESPIVVMKPSRPPFLRTNRRLCNDSPLSGFRSRAGVHRTVGNGNEFSPAVSQRRERPEVDRNVRNQTRGRNLSSPTGRESSSRSPNTPARTPRRQPTSDETQQSRASPVHSPRLSPKRIGSDQTITTRSQRNGQPTAEIRPKEKTAIIREDESSSISESSVSTSSQTDTEFQRWKMEEHKGGRSLLERCDKLLHSIAEITATESQPSPVSVLDSFYDSSSPSPVLKRSVIDFKDQLGEFEEEIWSPAISPIRSKFEDKSESEDCDFIYISEILRSFNYLPEDSNIFLLLEKQQCIKGKDTSEVSRLQRRLIFDTIGEILDRNRQLPAWKVSSYANPGAAKSSLRQIWSEFQRIRERDTAEDLVGLIGGVLRKDLARDAINGWGDCPVETSEAVLDIERLIFKDLVGETIRDLAAFAGNCIVSAPRRKLVF